MKYRLKKTLRGMSNDELLDDMRRGAALLGKHTITMAEYAEVGKGHPSTIYRRFGSWIKALELAGLQPSRPKIGISNQELFENIKRLWMSLGRQPLYSEVKAPDSCYSAGTYENRFGSWSKALEEFVAWVNSDEEMDDESDQELTEYVSQASTSKRRRTKREVSERMRFRILLRDGFSCKSCGVSPLKTPGVELHVDHIVPWSKGGETLEDNLQTKCARCNLGKGNAFNG